jgi:hypothetical protein
MNTNSASGKVEFYVSDVGRGNWEEVSVGGTGYEKANYGWCEREGPCETGETSSDNCGIVDPSKFTDPIYFYEHTSPGRGYAIVGGSFIPTVLAFGLTSTIMVTCILIYVGKVFSI